jgi:hypothetical protein
MQCWRIDTLGDTEIEDRCILDLVPDGLGVEYWRLMEGSPCSDFMPDPARIRMSRDRDGLTLLDIMGNTNSMLMVHRTVAETIQAHCDIPIEYFGFDLIDHKGRVFSRDFVIVNPLGAFDAIDHGQSEIDYFKNTDKIVSIDRLVLDPEKLDKAPPLFRLEQDPTEYYVTDAFANLLREKQFSGLVLCEVGVRDRGTVS